MNHTRREFLVRAAALPAVFGLPLAGCVPAGQPAWVPEALSKIRSEGRLGLAVRLPKDPEQRCRIGHRLTRLLNSDKTEDHAVVAELVVLCLEEDAFRGRFGRRDAAALLIDGDGYAIDALSEWTDELTGLLRTLIDGPDGARGRQRAETARKRAVEADLKRIENPQGSDVALLASRGPVLLPLLVSERRAAGATPRGTQLGHAIEIQYQALSETERGPRLPYGIELVKGVRGGCGSCGCEEKPISTRAGVACGMAFHGPNSRSFVKFLAT